MRSWVFEIPREPGTLEMPRKLIPRVSPCSIRVNPSLFSSRPGAQDKRGSDMETSLEAENRASVSHRMMTGRSRESEKPWSSLCYR